MFVYRYRFEGYPGLHALNREELAMWMPDELFPDHPEVIIEHEGEHLYDDAIQNRRAEHRSALWLAVAFPRTRQGNRGAPATAHRTPSRHAVGRVGS